MYENRSRYKLVEVTDLRSRTKSYKIFRRGFAGKEPPLFAGIASKADAEAKCRELEELADAEQAQARKMAEIKP